MNRSELIKQVAKLSGYMESDVSEVIRMTFDLIEEKLLEQENVKIAGFGSWNVEKKESRNGFNPRKNEKIVIPERRVLKFRASKKLRERVRGE